MIKDKPLLINLKSLLLVVIPIFGGNIVGQIQQLTDQYFLGNLDIVYLSAVSSCVNIVWYTNSILISLATGATILIAHLFGDKEALSISSVIKTGIFFVIPLSFVLFFFWVITPQFFLNLIGVNASVNNYIFEYLYFYKYEILITTFSCMLMSFYNGTGFTKIILYYSLIRCTFNIFLDWGLIFGNAFFPCMGIRGAALATILSDFFATLLIFLYLFTKSNKLKPYPIDLIRSHVNKEYLKKIFNYGFPCGIEQIVFNTGTIFILQYLNKESDYAVGIYGILNSLNMISTIFFNSLGNGLIIEVGQNYKENKHFLNKKLLSALILGGAFVLVVLIINSIIPSYILRLFTKDNSIINISVPLLIISTFTLIPRLINIIYGNSIKALGKSYLMLITQVLGTIFVISCSLMLVNVKEQNLKYIFFVIFFDEAVRSIINVPLFYKKMKS